MAAILNVMFKSNQGARNEYLQPDENLYLKKLTTAYLA